MRVYLAILLLGLLAASAAIPGPAAAIVCAQQRDFEQMARQPGIALFAGRPLRLVDDGERVAFAVERWFTGPHRAQVVLFAGSWLKLAEPPAAGVIPAVLAATSSGAITLVRGEPVFMAATWSATYGAFVPDICGIGATPLDEPAAREYLALALARYGQGVAAADLPATATAPGTTREAEPTAGPLPLVAFGAGLAGALRFLARHGRIGLPRAGS
jgi:hypothetical protein